MAAIFRLGVVSCQWLASAELEADAVNGFDDIVAIHGRQFGADIADVAVDGAVRHLDVELIGGAHDLLAAEDERRPCQKCPEDSELDGREPKRGSRKLGEMLFGVDGKPALRQRSHGRLGILPARSHATQDDVHPCYEFARAEGFCDIVVTADLQAQYTIDLVVTGGEKQDRNVRGLSDFAAHIQAVEFRHADIQNDQIRPVGGEAGQRFLAVARLEDSHSGLLECNTDDLADVQVVVYDENAVRQRSLREVVRAVESDAGDDEHEPKRDQHHPDESRDAPPGQQIDLNIEIEAEDR